MTSAISLPHPIRDMKRYVEILAVLMRHGFGDIIHETKLDRLMEKGRELVGLTSPVSSDPLARPVRLRRVLEELGPTFIKLGQLLSTRPDLIPASWAAEFRGLQYDCPSVPFEAIKTRLDQQFPGRLNEVFRSIEEVPLATASIAQVHRAVLHDGTPLLLKIVRPGTEEIVEADFAILNTLAEFSENHFVNQGFSPTEVVQEFGRSIRRELDLVHEGRSTERFRNLFAEDKGVIFPKIYWEATTKSVLGVEEMKGPLLSHVIAGALPSEERRALVQNGARAVFRQCLEVGIFHADPHPGNLIALPGGKIAFIDCGMIGQLDAETLRNIGELAVGVVHGDVPRVIRVVALLADARPEKVEERAFRVDVREFVSHFDHGSLGSLNIGALLQEFFEKIRKHGLRCPADLVLLIKALSAIESVGKDLDPSFDMISFAEPYLRDLVHSRYSSSAVLERANQALLQYAELAEKLPFDVGQIVKQLKRNKWGMTIEHSGLPRLTETIEHASRNIGFALIVSALLISSSILVLADRGRTDTSLSTIGIVGFGVACLLLVFRVIVNWRRKV